MMRFDAAAASSWLDEGHDAVRELLAAVGETPERPGVVDTPRRVVAAWKEFTSGALSDLDSVVGRGVFEMEQVVDEHPGQVALRDIPFSCLSAETLLPIYGQCHVAYEIEGNRILGLSKIARLANVTSRRIQTQQQFTDTLREVIAQKTGSSKVLVLATATHIYYDRHLRVVSTFAARSHLGHASDDLQDLEALLPPDLPTAASRDAEPTIVKAPRGDAATLDRIHDCLHSMIASARIELPHQDALHECARQLYHATIGLRDRGTSEIGTLPILCDSDEENNDQKNPRFASCVLEFVSTCEHHLLPFHGRVFVGCSSSGPLVTDLSAVVGGFVASRSRSLQVQERLTNQIADFVSGEFPSSSVVVLCDALHLCMVARGPEAHQTATRTSCRRGVVPKELMRIGCSSLERKCE